MIKLSTIYIPKLYYGGIDESNHGRTPEIYVTTLSSNEKEIIPSSNIPKIRSKKSLANIVKDLDDYKYTKISKKVSDFYGKGYTIKSQAISRLLIALELYPNNMFVFVDGGCSIELHENILYLFNSNQNKGTLMPKNLQFMIHGDQIYPIINKADRLAYKIYREIERNSNYKIQRRYVKIPLIR